MWFEFMEGTRSKRIFEQNGPIARHMTRETLTFVSAPERLLGVTPRALGPKLSRQARSKSVPAKNHLDKPGTLVSGLA